jgi:hypothetical protein
MPEQNPLEQLRTAEEQVLSAYQDADRAAEILRAALAEDDRLAAEQGGDPR